MVVNGTAALDAQLGAAEFGAAYRDGCVGAGGGDAEHREHGDRDDERAAKIHVPSFVRGGPPRMRHGWLGFHSTLVVGPRHFPAGSNARVFRAEGSESVSTAVPVRS